MDRSFHDVEAGTVEHGFQEPGACRGVRRALARLHGSGFDHCVHDRFLTSLPNSGPVSSAAGAVSYGQRWLSLCYPKSPTPCRLPPTNPLAQRGMAPYRMSTPALLGVLMAFVQTDSRSRVVLPGHPDQMFQVQENEDGSILLQPARVVTEAQAEYDETPELQELLSRAMASPTKKRRRSRA
jgi:hypothetical protein